MVDIFVSLASQETDAPKEEKPDTRTDGSKRAQERYDSITDALDPEEAEARKRQEEEKEEDPEEEEKEPAAAKFADTTRVDLTGSELQNQHDKLRN